MPLWLQIISSLCAPLGFILSLYLIYDKKKNQRIEDIKQLKSDMIEVKRITGIIDEYMQELLLENLKGKK